MQQDLTQVAIPTALYQRVTAALDRLGQPSVDAFVAYAVRTALTAVEIMKRILNGEVKPGFQTPSLAYGKDFILQLDGVKREDL